MTKWLSRKSADGSKWLHPAESLMSGQVVYTVKLFGSVDASGIKGIDVVRDAMQKTKFNRQLLKADGVKCPKVDLIISVDNVVVRNAKTKAQMHLFPLQQLSYCADDKAERRLFAFVARDSSTSGHRCFVFDSEKCAEEITLTIGQAFELAYQKYLEEKPTESIKALYSTELKEIKEENALLRQRVAHLEGMLAAHGIQVSASNNNGSSHGNGSSDYIDRPRLGSTGSGASNNTEPEQERFSTSQNNGDHLLIESLSFSSQTTTDESGKSIPALPPPTIPARALPRSASADNGNLGKLPSGPPVVAPPAVAASGTARPRPQPKLPALSETNPFKAADFPPPTAFPPSQPPQAVTTLAVPSPVKCLMDSTWSSASSGHVAALADFDPLTMKSSS